MGQRFFVENHADSGKARLVGAEAHHAARVMRLGVGDEVRLFDGRGAEFTARIVEVSRSEVRLEVLEQHEVDRELQFNLTLGVALPKGERQRWLVEKAVELGGARLVPLITQRSVAQPSDKTVARLRRTVIEATKQCGRTRLMQVAAPQPLHEYLLSAPVEATRWIAHFQGEALGSCPETVADVFCTVGPEGGFTDSELAAGCEAGWQLVSLGRRVLRVETAAIAIAAHLSLCDEPRL